MSCFCDILHCLLGIQFFDGIGQKGMGDILIEDTQSCIVLRVGIGLGWG